MRIAAVATSCVCTTAELAKETFAPGEDGQLRVEFDVGPQTGRQERSITITTDEGLADPTILKIVVDIGELVSVQPKLLFWKANEAGEEKTVLVTISNPAQGQLGEVHVAGSDFSVRMNRDEKSGRYKLWVKPSDTAHAKQTVIRVDATIDGQSQSLSIFAAVKS